VAVQGPSDLEEVELVEVGGVQDPLSAYSNITPMRRRIGEYINIPRHLGMAAFSHGSPFYSPL
jgi:hypothetical protein